MITNKKLLLVASSWFLAGLTVFLAGMAWWQVRGGRSLTAYDIFPFFGMAAFSLMWTHYIAGSLRRYLKLPQEVNRSYFNITSLIVLVTIVLHPGILIAQLYRDGLGLPPDSYQRAYPGSSMAILFGSIALIIFLIFEMKKKFSKKSWWRYVELGQLLAMALIFFHGLSLGHEMAVEWYRVVWCVLGLSFLLSVGYNYWQDKAQKGGTDERKGT